MDSAMIAELLWPPTIWHWLALAAVLFSIEMMAGTFDLLMVAIASAVTAAWTAFVPGEMGEWQAQLLVFFATSVVLITLGRTVLSGIRSGGPGDPVLNDRMARLLGARALVVADFSSGQGRVKIGDTEWQAESEAGTDIPAGTTVTVEGAKSTTVLVKPV
ncbi:MAG: NfeD family protein [Hyphomonadaceae bacterium]|nr:NfeD family protein [Hyphomonadaceae bacterium]